MGSIDKAMFLVVGKFGSTFGVKGWLKVHSYTEYGPDIIEYKPWHIANANGWNAITIEDYKVQSSGVLVKLSGIDAPEDARQFTGKEIAITRSQLPKLPSNEYYWSDLEGLNVVNTEGQDLGKVQYIMATGANDVLVVKGEKEHAIPYLPTVIKEVDMANKQILVNWEII